jgi:hypothetical protein
MLLRHSFQSNRESSHVSFLKKDKRDRFIDMAKKHIGFWTAPLRAIIVPPNSNLMSVNVL